MKKEEIILHSSENKALEAYRTAPVFRVVVQNSIPALIAMVMVMVYNLADTFFLGLTHDDLQVAAVSFASPLFMIFMSLGTLFGVGGTSVISRALGAGETERAKNVSSFCFWSCVAIGLLLMAVLWLFLDGVTAMLGAVGEGAELTRSYLAITIGCGVLSMISNCFSNVIRTEGEAMKAMTGTVVGNLVNLILDPIMILALRWGVVGAAVATVIGNAVSAAYYLAYFLRGRTALSISPHRFSCRDGILRGVVSVGISASLSNLLVSLSSIVVNARLADYEGGALLVAGYGVTSKVLLIVTLIGVGIGSGVQPFFGFCFGAGEKKRLREGIRTAALFGLACCGVISVAGYLFAEPIVRVFLTKPEAFSAGVRFTRILMLTAWLIGAFAVCQSTLQAVGAAKEALWASVLRQAVIFLPAALILNRLCGADGLVWAQPAADVLSLALVILLLRTKLRSAEKESSV